MRRSDREVKEIEAMLEIIRKCEVCRLAICDEPVPYILPMNFGLEIIGEDILLYFHGANEGKKYELLRKNNRVGFEMDCGLKLITSPENGSCTMEYESVIGDGYIEIVKEEEKEHALEVIMGQYHHEDFEFNRKVIPRTTVMRLKVDHMTGKMRKKYMDK